MRYLCAEADGNGNPIPGSGCGELRSVEFDGYHFGERTLEGVTFVAEVDDEGVVSARSKEDWDSDLYLRTLNKEYWLGAALAHAKEEDCPQCPSCGSDVFCWPDQKPKKEGLDA